MSMMKWNPEANLPTFSGDILGIQRGINRMFESFFREGLDDDELTASRWNPAVDIAEKDTEYIVRMELPGVSKDDVRITTQESILTISGEKKEEKESKGSRFHRVERSYGSFQRSFTLPTIVRSDKIEASFKDGMLTVNIPKAEEAKPKLIEVKVS